MKLAGEFVVAVEIRGVIGIGPGRWFWVSLKLGMVSW